MDQPTEESGSGERQPAAQPTLAEPTLAEPTLTHLGPPSIIERDDIQRLLKCITAGLVLIGTARFIISPQETVVQTSLSAVSESTTGFKVDVNHASIEELLLLPQVGPMLAGRIVAERETGGAFTSVEDLSRTAGIGPETVERLRGLIAINR